MPAISFSLDHYPHTLVEHVDYLASVLEIGDGPYTKRIRTARACIREREKGDQLVVCSGCRERWA